MEINTKLRQIWSYKKCINSLIEPYSQHKFINEMCEIAELEFLSSIPRAIGGQKITAYLNNMCLKFNVDFDVAYLRERWKKLFRTKIYKNIDSHVGREIFRRDKNKCQYCNRIRGLEIHHVIPKSKKYGGPDSYFNLVLACKDCNLEISNTIVLPQNWWELHSDSKYALLRKGV